MFRSLVSPGPGLNIGCRAGSALNLVPNIKVDTPHGKHVRPNVHSQLVTGLRRLSHVFFLADTNGLEHRSGGAAQRVVGRHINTTEIEIYATQKLVVYTAKFNPDSMMATHGLAEEKKGKLREHKIMNWYKYLIYTRVCV